MDFWGRKPENDFIRAFEEVTEGHENNHESQLSTERMEKAPSQNVRTQKRKKRRDSAWFIGDDRTMLALALTFRKEPDAQIMCFMRNYTERYDWLVQVFQDWSFTFLSSLHPFCWKSFECSGR